MRDLLDLGRQVLASQPFSVFLGVELVAAAEGNAEFKIPIRDDLKQHYGFVHGGVIGSAADTALTFAGGTVLGGAVVTSGFTINFLRPARGDFLIARATVVYGGRTQAVCRCDVFVSEDGVERLCATAQGTIAQLRSQGEKG